MTIRIWLLGTAALATGCVLVAAAAQSQQVPATDTQTVPADNNSGLGDIIVTAQRRSQNLQTVPIAATALSGGQLQQKAVVSVTDLQFASPGLQITEGGTSQSVNIRGIGIASGSPAVQNGVASYVDGVLQTPIAQNTSSAPTRPAARGRWSTRYS